MPLGGVAVMALDIWPETATAKEIGSPLELHAMFTVTPVAEPGFQVCVALELTAVNFAGAPLMARVTTMVGLVDMAEVNWTEAEYVPGSMAAAVALATKETVATEVVALLVVPVCVTVSQPGTVLVTTLKNVEAVVAVRTSVTAAP